MRSHGTPSAIPLLALALALTLLGCSKDKSTNPTNTATLELNSGNLGNSAQFPHRFFRAGTFPYHCSIHTGMTGSVTVSDAAAPGDTMGTVSIAGFAFSPSSIAIHTGGKVTWTNNDMATHTVTSN